MKTCKDCFNFSMCDEPYTEEEIKEYTISGIAVLCRAFKDKANFIEISDMHNYIKPVRCKDCTQYLERSGRCWRMCFPMGADDYCSKAERK